ncbi:hypothetical protein [Caulobacter hibisci]|uniref:Lipoprotein n=1 Tax=Caulobacter hibisci TaxID=2035993 RepID=A0ABS0STR3_9CAUL|nr:hypothetical protein [Caulobacter hibisci]MBI1682621.1 hypothetical protein [Caulobacter hibisci]
MVREALGAVALLTGLALAACAPEPASKSKPKPSDGFAAADRPLVDAALAQASKTFSTPGSVEIRDLVISEVEGEGRSVCFDAAEPGQRWVGFVVRPAKFADGMELVEEQDALSPRARPQCRALVLKYLGERDVNPDEAEIAFNQAGCMDIDGAYWDAWKRACNGRQTRPAGVAGAAR